MRMSRLFLRTLREVPADAEVPSHRLLVRAGYIRRAAPGIYSWLPLGLRVLRNIENIVREEMDAMGAQELQFPALLPREPYEATGRWTEYGANIFRLKDRKDGDYLLGPTHEELFTLVVKDLYSSYKDLPVWLYQIQTKYRDEARPRAGLLRGREFVMKDSYSFDVDDAGLDRSYDAHRQAYIKTFDRLGFDYVIVKATAGAMGGSKSEEFLARSAVGEDTYVRCTTCDYAANVEAVQVRAPGAQSTGSTGWGDVPAAHAEDTPDTPTIDTLVDHLNQAFPRDDRPWAAGDTLKNVLVMLKHPDGTREPLAIGVPGDREVDQKRLEGQLEPIEVEAMDEVEFRKHPALVKGYIGPGALGEESASGIRYLVDPRVSGGTRWVTGADTSGQHVVDLVAGRDFATRAIGAHVPTIIVTLSTSIGVGLAGFVLGAVEDWRPELNFEAAGWIPREYIPDEEVRLNLYARIARLAADAHAMLAVQRSGVTLALHILDGRTAPKSSNRYEHLALHVDDLATRGSPGGGCPRGCRCAPNRRGRR